MKILWVLIHEPYRDDSNVLGIFDDKDAAIAALLETIKDVENIYEPSDTWYLFSCEANTTKMRKGVWVANEEGYQNLYKKHTPYSWTNLVKGEVVEVDLSTFEW